MTRSGVLVVACLVALPVAQRSAGAQEAAYMAVAPPVGDRSGFTIGGSLGRGRIAIECDICDNVAPLTEALSTSVHVGYLLNPQLAIIAEHWAIIYNDRGSDWFPDSKDHAVEQHLQTFGAQLWVTRRAYLRAGLGFGWHKSESYYAQVPRDDAPVAAAAGGSGMSEAGPGTVTPAATVGVGFEFVHTRSFAADVQFRAGTTRRPADEYQVHNVGLNFGVAWY